MLKTLKTHFKKVRVVREMNRSLYRFGIKKRLRKPAFRLLSKAGLFSSKGRENLDYQGVRRYLVADSYNFNLEKIHIYEGITTNIVDPTALTDMSNFSKQKSLTVSPAYLYIIPNVILRGSHANVFDSEGSFIVDSSFPIYKENCDYHTESSVSLRTTIQNILFSKFSNELEYACSLIHTWNNNYFHWMLDTLPRLEAIKKFQESSGAHPKIIIHSNATKWQRDTLLYLGFNNIVEWKGESTKVKTYLLPTYRKNFSEGVYLHTDPRVYNWLSNEIKFNIPKCSTKFSPFVYISRSKAIGRRVINEEQVISKLTSLGFVSYNLEDLSLSEQVHLFDQAKVVISAHGAGLTNLIFSKQLRVIELFGENIPIHCFSYISRCLNFDYSFLNCIPPSHDHRKWDADMVVNVDHLLHLLDN